VQSIYDTASGIPAALTVPIDPERGSLANTTDLVIERTGQKLPPAGYDATQLPPLFPVLVSVVVQVNSVWSVDPASQTFKVRLTANTPKKFGLMRTLLASLCLV
jgi:hypothetical protein